MQKKPEFVCIAEFDHRTTFGIIEQGVYRWVQFHNSEVSRSGDFYTIAHDAQPTESVRQRSVQERETVNPKAELSDRILAYFQPLKAAA